MSLTHRTPARRVVRLEVLAWLVATLPAGAAFASEPAPNLVATPLPKVEIQTVGSGPHVLNAIEQQKAAALSVARPLPFGSATYFDGTRRIEPWSPRLAPIGKDTGFSTFLPIPGFDTRAIATKPSVVTPNTAVEKKVGPVR